MKKINAPRTISQSRGGPHLDGKVHAHLAPKARESHILKDITATGRMFHHNLIANILPRQDSVHAIFRNLMDGQNAAEAFAKPFSGD